MKFAQDVKFAPHIMGRSDLAAERRAAQNHFSMTKLYAIGEIRMAARKLCDPEKVCLAWKMRAQKRLEFAEFEFLAGANGSGFVLEVGHVRGLLLG